MKKLSMAKLELEGEYVPKRKLGNQREKAIF
jgi:hypothetical protein